MATTYNTLKTLIDDLRIDGSSGSIDMDTEGLRAINATLHRIQIVHDWEYSQQDSTFRYYPGKLEYAIPAGFKNIRSISPYKNFFDDFLMIEPTVFQRLTRRGHHESLCALEKSFKRKFYVYYPRTMAKTLTLHENRAIDANGTWTADVTTDASGVATEGNIGISNQGSVTYDLTVAQSVNDYGDLSLTMDSNFDLSDYTASGAVFLEHYMKDVTYLTGFTLRIGNDSSNYYETSVTVRSDGASFNNGINLLEFDLESSTETGTVDDTAIDYLHLRTSYSSSQSDAKNLRLGRMWISTYEDMELKHYTWYNVKDADTGALSEKFDAGNEADIGLYDEAFEELVATGAVAMLLRYMGDTEESDTQQKKFDSLLKDWRMRTPAKTKIPNAPQLIPSIALNEF